MTANQINYWNLKETNRHNVVTEGETNRHNVVTEGETHRHNVVTEGIDLGKLNESIRHNMQTEYLTGVDLGIKRDTLNETKRHNLATEDIGYKNVGLGYSQLSETGRHNLATEGLTGIDLNISSGQLSETQRHNKVVEEQQAAVNKVQNELTAAKAEAQKIENLWIDLKNSTSVSYTKEQIKQVENYINKMNKEINVLEKDLQYYDAGWFVDNGTKIANSMSQAVRAAGTLVDGLIPG